MADRTTTIFSNNKVYKGVAWKADKNNIYIKSYPSRRINGVSYKIYEKVWKSYCTECKKSGTLDGHGTGPTKKGSKWGLEGQVYCVVCGADYCGVTGKELSNTSRSTLKQGSSVSGTAQSAKNDTTDKKINNIRAVKKKMKPSKTYGDITLHRPVNVVDMVKMNILAGKMLIVESVTIDREGYHCNLTDDLSSLLTEEYKEPSKSTSGATNVAGDVKGKTQMQTWFMRKGAELKTADACFAWLRSRGTGGFTYSGYAEHKKSGELYKWHEESAKWCYQNKLFNCVDAAWLLAYMFVGAGLKKVQIHHGSTCKGVGHFWVLLNGKPYDPTSSCQKGTRGRGTFITLS
ncbi:MAG: hypothetical protein ACRC1M_05710 [Methanobacteriaceae archaeon]